MKFLETINATWINVDQISHISHEYHDPTEQSKDGYYTSLIYLKNGGNIDFIEVIDAFYDDDGKEVKFTLDYLIELQRSAVKLLAKFINCDILYFITMEEIEETAWKIFFYDYKIKSNKALEDK